MHRVSPAGSGGIAAALGLDPSSKGGSRLPAGPHRCRSSRAFLALSASQSSRSWPWSWSANGIFSLPCPPQCKNSFLHSVSVAVLVPGGKDQARPDQPDPLRGTEEHGELWSHSSCSLTSDLRPAHAAEAIKASRATWVGEGTLPLSFLRSRRQRGQHRRRQFLEEDLLSLTCPPSQLHRPRSREATTTTTTATTTTATTTTAHHAVLHLARSGHGHDAGVGNIHVQTCLLDH